MHRHRLLIVEDDGDTRTSLGGIFSRMGWMVRLASTAAEGLDWINAGHEPCCLILDLGLPDGDGESVLRLAREKGLRTYVAVCTGVTDEERLSLVSSLGPDLILTKPVTATDIWKDVCRLSDLHDTTADMPVVK
jgi:two-component system KDP operon response regulator KdpE